MNVGKREFFNLFDILYYIIFLQYSHSITPLSPQNVLLSLSADSLYQSITISKIKGVRKLNLLVHYCQTFKKVALSIN